MEGPSLLGGTSSEPGSEKKGRERRGREEEGKEGEPQKVYWCMC